MSEELRDGWVRVRLDQIAEVRLGRQRSPKNHAGDNMRPYLRAANVGWQGLKLDDVKSMNFTDAEAAIYRLEPGDIVMSEASGSPGEVGKPALWNGEIPDCCLQNTLIRVRSYGANPRFLLHLIRHEALRGAFAVGARGVGIHHLGVARIASLEINLPPLAEQQRIVEALEGHLSRLESAKAILSNTLPRARLLARSLYTDAVEGRLGGGQDSSVGQIAEFLSGRSKEFSNGRQSRQYSEPAAPDLEIPPRVPVGWGLFSLEAVTHPVRTIRYGILMPKVELGQVPYVEVKDLVGNTLVGKTLHKTSPELDAKFSGSRIMDGDVVLAVRGSYDRSAVVTPEMAGANLSRDVVRLAPMDGLLPTYLQIYLQSAFAQRYLRRHARGVAVKGVNVATLRAMPIVVPPPSEQRRIVETVEHQIEVLGRIEAEVRRVLARAAHLQRALLATALAGHLVSQDPGDESAPDFLARFEGRQLEGARPFRIARTRPAIIAQTAAAIESLTGYQEELSL